MKLKFKAVAKSLQNFTVSHESVNDIDLSVIEHKGEWIGNEDTEQAGIIYASRDQEGELWVTLAQATLPYSFGCLSSDWVESDWINLDAYVDGVCYVVPSSVPKEINYKTLWITKVIETQLGIIENSGWTVVLDEGDAGDIL